MARLEGSGAYTVGGSGIPPTGVYDLESDGYLTNRPPHKSFLQPNPWSGRISRGMIRAHSDWPGGRMGSFQFHFNPFHISIDYSQFAGDPLADQEFRAAGGTGLLLGAYQVSFDLLLNRQYDVIFDPANRGTLEDIDVLMALVGYSDFVSNRPVSVLFGTDFSVDGVISRLSVGHHQFTARMIPYYSTVSMTITNMPTDMPTMFATGTDPGATVAQPMDYAGSTAIGLSPGGGPTPS